MEAVSATSTTKGIGHKIAKIREFRGMKQETLARMLNVSQQAVSKLEGESTISEEKLNSVAEALGVTPQAIKDFDEEKVIYNINNIQNNTNNVTENTFDEKTTPHIYVGGIAQQYNPIDKIVELYERLLKSESEKVEILKKAENKE